MTGIVTAVDEQSARVRVMFPDLDDLVSDWLPVLQEFCVGNKAYRLPDVDNQVVCLMDANYEAGVVLGAIYSDADPPPVTDADLYYRRFSDGTVLQYDRAGHKFTADVQGSIDVKATGTCDATITGNTTIQCQSPVLLKSTVSITIQAPSLNFSGNSPATGSFEGNLTITGNLEVTGNVHAAGNVSDTTRSMAADRQIYNGHTHQEHGTGGGTTGTPSQGM